MYGKISIKIILILNIQACPPNLIQECHNILIVTCHLIFIQSFQHTKFVYVHISVIILCMNLMYFHTIPIYHH